MIDAGAVLGSFQAKLGLDATDYAKGMINAEASSRIFGQTFTSFVSNPLLGSIGIMKQVAGAAIGLSQVILADAEAIERLSQQTGASEPLLIALQKQLELSGFSAERARQSFLVFNKFIADYNNDGPLANEVLRQLGMNLDGISGFDPTFRAIIDRLSQIEDPAMKAMIAMKLFGEEAGHDVINAIGGGNAAIDEMIDRYTRLGFVIDRYTNTQLADMNTHLGITHQAIEGIKTNAIREFLLGINGDLEVTDKNIVSIADRINTELGPAARSFGEWAIPTLEGAAIVFDLLNKGSDAVADFFAWVSVASERGSVLNTDGTITKFPPPPTEAQLRNRERGQQYLIEEMGL